MKIVKLDEVDKINLEEYFESPVVIPTETVYGLAARIDNEKALQEIFTIKGRPSNNPLIVHISDEEMLKDLINEEIPEEYRILMDKFWPGPLTLIFKCKDNLSMLVRGQKQTTVAVRMPKNEHLRSLIKKLGTPLAAPSANTSGKPSPTLIEHVIDDLGEKVQLYIDDGPCEVGLESTVFGIVNGKYIILRPGSVTKEDIEGTLKKEILVKNKADEKEELICPGQMYKHYSPQHPVYLFGGMHWKEKMVEYSKKFPGLKIGLLKRKRIEYPVEFAEEYVLGETLKECISNIFAGLRSLDKKCDLIFVLSFELKKEGLAIMDRLDKAATYIIK